MRFAFRVSLALLGLLVAAMVGLGLFLPRVVDRPEVRARIEAAAKDATGRQLTYSSLAAGIFPPTIEVVHPTLAGDVDGGPPLFSADLVALRVALLPLLARSVVFERLRVDGARIHVVRGGDAAPAATPGAVAPPSPPPPFETSASAGMTLGVRTLDVENATLTVEDRSVSPPTRIVVEELDATARASSPTEPVTIDASMRLASGGRIRIEGTATLAGIIDAVITLEQVEAEPFAAWLGRGRRVAGRFGGTIHATGPALAPANVDAKLVFDGATVEVDAVRLAGKLLVSATLANPLGPTGSLSGPFEIDATQAELAYGGAFRKPPGTPATTSGTLKARADGGFDVDELHVKIKNFDAQGRARSGARNDLVLAAPAFELDGWEALLPALGGFGLGGGIALDDLRVATSPPDTGGALVLQDVRAGLPGQPPIVLNGRIEGTGNALRSRDLGARVAGQAVTLEVSMEPLDPLPIAKLVAQGRDLDAAALLAALSKSGSPVTGPLRFDAQFQLPVEGRGAPLSRVTGRLDFAVGPGRFKGMSLLRDTIERSGPVVQAAVAAGTAFGGRDVRRMYDDSFETIGGVVNVAAGRARFDPIRAVYRDYRLDLRGSVRLEDRALDASGQIVFADAKGAGAMRGQTLPISHIGGTLDEPRVELSPEDIAAVVASVSGSAMERKIAPLVEKLRQGAGGAKSPLDALQGLFGGKKRN